MIEKSKARRNLGLILVIYYFLRAVLLVLNMISHKEHFALYSDTYAYLLSSISFLPASVLATSFFVKNEKVHRIVLGISFFLGCLFEMLVIMQQVQKNSDILFLPVFYMVIYGVVGYFAVSDQGNKKAGVVTVLSFAVVILCLEVIRQNASSIEFSRLSTKSRLFIYSFIHSLWSAFGFIELFFVTLDMALDHFVPKGDTQPGITISNDLISFKDLLLFIENEYRLEKLSEQEYNRKRNEILSKL